MTEHYTTVTLTEYNHMANTITLLRWKHQKIRELLERGLSAEALALLQKAEDEKETP